MLRWRELEVRFSSINWVLIGSRNVITSGILVIFCSLALAGCAPTISPEMTQTTQMEMNQSNQLTSLPDLGAAPEINNEIWLNAAEPLRLSDLKGHVVLLEMWTYGCINCKNVIPKLQEWHATYASKGLVIIGNHYPEFGFEASLENLKAAVGDLGIEYAVAQDNEGETWRAYENHYWPALFLIDKTGRIRYQHIGEGAYARTEDAIKFLLAEAP